MSIQLSEEGQRSLLRIGEAVANYRPDLNINLSDSVVVDAALFALHALIYSDETPADIIVLAINTSLAQERTE